MLERNRELSRLALSASSCPLPSSLISVILPDLLAEHREGLFVVEVLVHRTLHLLNLLRHVLVVFLELLELLQSDLEQLADVHLLAFRDTKSPKLTENVLKHLLIFVVATSHLHQELIRVRT